MEIREISANDLKHAYFSKRYDITCGAVYIAKYENGFIKIGSTSTPRKRYEQLSYVATEYAGAKIERFAITNPVEEYKTLERALHGRFAEYNIRKELFDVDFKKAIYIINKEFNKFDQPEGSYSKFVTSGPAFINILRSGRMPTDEEKRMLAIMAFTDGMDAYDF